MNNGSNSIFNFERGSKANPLRGRSSFGEWSMYLRDIYKIDFNPSVTSQPQVSVTSSEFGQILLKNGDIISGEIKTGPFKLRTPYGTLTFEADKISSIDFEGGGQNIDVVVFKVGDKISGVVEVDTINLLMRSGTEVNLDKEEIKQITFHK